MLVYKKIKFFVSIDFCFVALDNNCSFFKQSLNVLQSFMSSLIRNVKLLNCNIKEKQQLTEL